MKSRINNSAALVLSFAITVAAPVARGQDAQQAATPDTRYGLFNLLDHRSSYGQGVFPEPFLVDDSDLEVNEVRLDWAHTKAHNSTSDKATAEIEKGFGPVTLEGEFHYEHNVEAGAVSEGIGNIDLGARCPFYQFVSTNDFVDTTFGIGAEVGIPVHSTVSKNAEFVPKIFNDLRLGEHLTIQTIAGHSTLFGPGPDGGTQVLEYGLDLGYAILHEQLSIPHVQRVIPMFELSGETELNKDNPGRNSLIGVAGLRVNTDTVAGVQPRLGLGFIFPVNDNARNDVHWGIVTSLVFEY